MLLSQSTPLKINPWILMGVFVLLVGPFTLDFHMHYPDEIYYRDAAIRMLQNGDYLTTYLGNGELRFKKPILTYWSVLAGFKLFGVNAFASRIFFLLAGAITVGLTHRMGRILFEDRKVADISALIMASNPVLILSAGRSIPDVLLVMTLAIASLGIVALLKHGDSAPKWAVWSLYLGLALAFEVKGLPAAALGILAILYLLLNPWQRIHWKKILHLPAILVSLFIALFWFVAMWQIHGPTYFASFLEDQVGVRVASRVWLIVQNGILATAVLLLIFIPWIIFPLGKLREGIIRISRENPQFLGFIILWGLAILGMSAMTSKFYERYLLPVAPVLAIGLGWFLVRIDLEHKTRGQKIAAWIFVLLSALIWGVSMWLFFKSPVEAMTGIKLFLGALILIYLVSLIRRRIKFPKVIAYAFLSIFLLLSTITDHLSFPHQGEQFRKSSREKSINSNSPVAFFGNLHVGSKIRMSLYPEVDLIDLKREDWKSELENYDQIITEDHFLQEIDRNQFELISESINGKSSAIPSLLLTLGTEDYQKVLGKNAKRYIWLKRKSPRSLGG
ncbi:ArnT family glycosyltransferase [Algoriphagus hitonicola]|uniref:4-amino-4-deoxy-L-arabinose transferase n=1 Tax=Algoriphagus hitonicola TaxID=435880 RepID=A0A1I2U4K6_9BACT|nr:glycosyltransferase family 39 protein [Algoriphagus hitonicola]SFG72085.1 4-amino-4-deoxy-L-arabinose transferase [Algoriphagus hitonicola]